MNLPLNMTQYFVLLKILLMLSLSSHKLLSHLRCSNVNLQVNQVMLTSADSLIFECVDLITLQLSVLAQTPDSNLKLESVLLPGDWSMKTVSPC